ncbi:transposase [Bacillus sp. FSL W7-1360]
MITERHVNEQLPNEINVVLSELEMTKHLRQSGIRKNFGFSCNVLFRLVFALIFHQKNWFALFTSKKREDFPGKDAIYRFLNYPKFAWRKFLLSLSTAVIQKVSALTSNDRPKVLIVDDSSYDRNRSKRVELLARCFDHSSTKNRFYKGFRMLTLGWSDGNTFIPIDFSLLSSKKSIINGINEDLDKRSAGYKRRKEGLQSAPEQLPGMIARALSKGVQASYVLMDSWFTQQPLIKAIVDQGIDVIGMVKNSKQRYQVNGKMLSLKELYHRATPLPEKKGVLRSITTTMANGVTVKVVFVRNRNKKREWLAVLSTDCTLSEQEIIRTYGIRWDIEVFFKTTKSLLRLQKEFQGRSYDSLISHTTIVFTRYIVLSWQNRCHNDHRTLGGVFYDLCDEMQALDWTVALQQLLELLHDAFDKIDKRAQRLIKSQLSHWIAGLPTYIKAYMPDLRCES